MTDTQILTIALAVVVPLSMLIYSNSRITEAKETLRAEMITMRMELNNKLDHLLEVVSKHDQKLG
jgi:pentose-5-phosphate-3-epimerase